MSNVINSSTSTSTTVSQVTDRVVPQAGAEGNLTKDRATIGGAAIGAAVTMPLSIPGFNPIPGLVVPSARIASRLSRIF